MVRGTSRNPAYETSDAGEGEYPLTVLLLVVLEYISKLDIITVESDNENTNYQVSSYSICSRSGMR